MPEFSQEEHIKFCAAFLEGGGTCGERMSITNKNDRPIHKMWECKAGHTDTLYHSKDEGEA